MNTGSVQTLEFLGSGHYYRGQNDPFELTVTKGRQYLRLHSGTILIYSLVLQTDGGSLCGRCWLGKRPLVQNQPHLDAQRPELSPPPHGDQKLNEEELISVSVRKQGALQSRESF